jgi:hypothetical protein
MSSHAAWVAFFDAQEARLQEFRSAHAFDEKQEKILGLLAESHRLCARSWRDTSTDADGEHTGNERSGKPALPRDDMSTMSGSEDTAHDSVPWQGRARLSTGSLAIISYASYSLSSLSAADMYAEYSVERLNDMSPHATSSSRVEKLVTTPPKVFRKTPIAPRAPPVSDEDKTSSSERPCAAARHSPEGDFNAHSESKAPWRDIMRQQRLHNNKKESEPTPCQVGVVRRS